MVNIREYLQTWKLKLRTRKTVSAVFHHTKKDEKRDEGQFQQRNPSFCSEPKHPGVALDRTLTYRRHLEPLSKNLRRTHEMACWLRMGWWGNNAANSHLSPSRFNSRALRCCRRAQNPCWPRYQRRLVNCDWMPTLCTGRQSSSPRRHPICWPLPQRSHIVSITSYHRAWTSASIYRVWTHSISHRDTHLCSPHNISSVHLTKTNEVRPSERITDGIPSDWRTLPDSVYQPITSAPTLLDWPYQDQHGSGLIAAASVSDVSAPACTNGIWPLLRLVSVVQRNTPLTMLSSTVQSIPRTAWPEGSGWCDNRIASERLPRDSAA